MPSFFFLITAGTFCCILISLISDTEYESVNKELAVFAYNMPHVSGTVHERDENDCVKKKMQLLLAIVFAGLSSETVTFCSFRFRFVEAALYVIAHCHKEFTAGFSSLIS